MSYRRTTDFLLHDWLEVSSLQSRARFADHNRETFDAVLDMCEKLAAEKFAPFNRLADTEEPWFDGEKVHLPAVCAASAACCCSSGRSRTSCRLKAAAMMSTSVSAWRSRASRIMRP